MSIRHALAPCLGCLLALNVWAQQAPASSPASAASSAASLRSLQQAAQADAERLARLPDNAPLIELRRQAADRLLSALRAREANEQPAPAPAAASTSQDSQLVGPPFSVLAVDRLRDQHDALLKQRSALQLALKSLGERLESAADTRRKSEEAVRLMRESAQQGTVPDLPEDQRAKLDLATLEVRAEEQELVIAAESRKATQERLAQIGAEIDKLDVDLRRAVSALQLDDDEIAAIDRRLLSALRALAGERRIALDRLATAAKGTADAARAQSSDWSTVLTVLAELDGVIREQRALWQLRRSLISAPADSHPEIAQRLQQDVERLQTWLALAEQRIDATRAAQQVDRAGPVTTPTGASPRTDVLAAGEAKERLLQGQRALRNALQESLTLARRIQEESSIAARPSSTRGWLALAGAVITGWAQDAWNFELFAASDSLQVDGRTVTVSRGVTVGKSVGMLLVIGIGYWLSRALSRGIVGLLVRSSVLKAQAARGAHRWVMGLLMLCVLLAALRLAHIPVTAFAFLGGALALGFGFGAQNVLKNLISGVIILFERKVRTGDVLTVGGVSGTVSGIDLRATTLRGFDGIDTVVPNSVLLEGQVNNWSLGSSTVRRSISVAVPHGTDLRHAMDLLVECATSQEGALDDPPPNVLLEDFSGPAVLLRLQYWYRLGGILSGPEVDSRLRLSISDRLATAGIPLAAG